MLCGSCILSVSSATTTTTKSTPVMGDATSDSKLDISDATAIQMHLAYVKTLDENSANCADSSGDGVLSIIDATYIQCYLAQLIEKLPCDTTYTISLSEIPDYTDSPYYVVNDNMPFFSVAERSFTYSFEEYSPLDDYNRCQVVYANVGVDLMPTTDRGSISSVYPSGWKYNDVSNNNKYDTSVVSGGYVYNRCHLIGWQLTGENANKMNLITGTRYLNIDGMISFENSVSDYVKETENHVYYRVTPMFDESNLVAKGVLMEAWSVEDNGEGICFNVFCYNVQPGIYINYATGENSLEEDDNTQETTPTVTYILNTNSKKFHYPTCSSALNMSASNKQEFYGTREELIEQLYSPCGICKP